MIEIDQLGIDIAESNLAILEATLIPQPEKDGATAEKRLVIVAKLTPEVLGILLHEATFSTGPFEHGFGFWLWRRDGAGRGRHGQGFLLIGGDLPCSLGLEHQDKKI